MGAFLTSASSQFLENTTPPFLTIPMTVGMWFNPTALATNYIYQLAAGASATANGEGWDIKLAATGTVNVGTAGGGTRSSASTVGTVAVGTWSFVVARWIAANNRRLDMLFATGATEHVQSTASNTPPGPITRESIGCGDNSVRSGFFGGTIAEFWQTNTDIQPDGLALSDQTLRQLALCGPFSIPSIRYNLTDYMSLRKSISSDLNTEDDYFSGSFGKQTWTNNAGVLVGQHPPAANNFKGPQDILQLGIV